MNKDTIAGKTKELGGEARNAIGKVTGDNEAQVRGKADELAGRAQKNFGKAKDQIEDSLED